MSGAPRQIAWPARPGSAAATCARGSSRLRAYARIFRISRSRRVRSRSDWIDAGDLRGQRRRRLFGLADDDTIAAHHLVVLDRFGKRRRDIHHHIALAESEIHVGEAFERGLELLDPLLHGHVECRERPRRHRSRRCQAMAQLEALDGLSESIVISAGRVVGAERRAARGSRCQKSRCHFDGGSFDGSSFMATLRRCCAPTSTGRGAAIGCGPIHSR
jgi:hypothetical protein